LVLTADRSRTIGDKNPSQHPLLRVIDLCVQLGGRTVVDGVSFAMSRGEMVGIIGPNGSGKTTALRATSGLIKPESGAVELSGVPLSDIDARARAKKVAYLPQGSGQGMSFTAMEIALMGRYPHLGRFEVEGENDREVALAALRRTGVEEFADRQIGDMSGGERQRVLIARSLAQEPELLLLDEPTASLDLKHQLELMSLVHDEVAAGMGAVVVLHDVALAARYCDRLVLMDYGRLVADGSPSHVLTAENLARVFEVEADIEIDKTTGRPLVRLIGPVRGVHPGVPTALRDEVTE